MFYNQSIPCWHPASTEPKCELCGDCGPYVKTVEAWEYEGVQTWGPTRLDRDDGYIDDSTELCQSCAEERELPCSRCEATGNVAEIEWWESQGGMEPLSRIDVDTGQVFNGESLVCEDCCSDLEAMTDEVQDFFGALDARSRPLEVPDGER